MKYFTVLDRQNGVIYDCAGFDERAQRRRVERTVLLTDEEMEEIHPWLKERGRELRFGKNLCEYDAYRWLRILTPGDYEKTVVEWVERDPHEANLIARDESGAIIRLLNYGCFDILPT